MGNVWCATGNPEDKIDASSSPYSRNMADGECDKQIQAQDVPITDKTTSKSTSFVTTVKNKLTRQRSNESPHSAPGPTTGPTIGPTTRPVNVEPQPGLNCYVKTLPSYEQFVPMIKMFINDVSLVCPIQEQQYTGSPPTVKHPLICFGVYMSRMDSNVAEALEGVKGFDQVVVVLIDLAKNIARRKHDLLYYQRTQQKHISCVSIIYHSNCNLDMSVPENIDAREQVVNALLTSSSGENKNVPSSQHVSETARCPQMQYTDKNVITSQSRRVDVPIVPWRRPRYDFTEEGRKHYAQDCSRHWQELDKCKSNFNWNVECSSDRNIIDQMKNAVDGLGIRVDNSQKPKTMFSTAQSSVILNTKMDTPMQVVGKLICVPAMQLRTEIQKNSDVHKFLLGIKQEQFKNEKHVLLVLTDVDKAFPNIDLRDGWHLFNNEDVARFVQNQSQKIGLPVNHIMPVISSDIITERILLLNVWESILKLSVQVEIPASTTVAVKTDSATVIV